MQNVLGQDCNTKIVCSSPRQQVTEGEERPLKYKVEKKNEKCSATRARLWLFHFRKA